MLYGVDVHPVFQAGLDIERVAREGFSWIEVKVSQGTAPTRGNPMDWITRAERAGMFAVPYHYLDAGNVDAQAATLRRLTGGRAAMVDVEKGSGTVQRDLRPFLAACARVGQRISLTYLPHWYWEQVGRPDLSGLPGLVASHYVSAQGTASALGARVPDSWWASYGGSPVAVLQHTDHALVAGRLIDANEYRGTHDQLAVLLGVHNPPAPPSARPVTVEDAVARAIPIQTWTGDDGRRYFRGAVRCEAASPAVRWGCVSWGAHWGDADALVTFLDAGGGVTGGHPNHAAVPAPANRSDSMMVPAGTRSVTIEGTLHDPAADIDATVWELPGAGT